MGDDEESSSGGGTKYRAWCVSPPYVRFSQTWRGPIRNSDDEAREDMEGHRQRTAGDGGSGCTQIHILNSDNPSERNRMKEPVSEGDNHD